MRRALGILFAVMGVVGIATVSALRKDDRPPPSVPPWVRSSTPRWQFTSKIVPIPADERFARAAGEIRVQLERGTDVRARVRMTRVQSGGAIQRATLSGRLRYRGGTGRVELDAYPDSAEGTRFRARFRDGELVEAQWLAGEGQASTSQPQLPLAIGDLPVDEAANFYRALRRGRLRLLGLDWSEGLGKVVLEMDLDRGPAPSGTTDGSRNGGRLESADVHGATALLWARLEPQAVECIRVFNRKGMLVRIYEGFGFGGHPRLESLRVISLPTGSYTTFRLEELEPVGVPRSTRPDPLAADIGYGGAKMTSEPREQRTPPYSGMPR